MKKQLLLFVTMLLAVVMPMKLWAADGNAEPYAVLSDNDTKLTFFYDDQKEIRGGLSVGPFNYSFERWGGHAVNIKIVEFDQSFANCTSITSTDYWFHECMNMVSISGLQYLKTDNVTSMCEMFRGCHSLTSLDVSHFNTENVTNMDAMFFDCSSLTSLDVSGFNTANVTNMRYMFWGCSGLISLDVSHFNTANVTDLSWMFASCSSLTSLDVSHFNTANVTNMERMFVSCSSVTSLDVSHFNTANVTNMGGMFASCSSLTSLDVSGFNTANVTSMESMFSGCSGLTSLDVSHFNTENVWNMNEMFYGCSGLASLDVSGFKTDNVTKMGDMFARCSGLTSIDVSGFNTENVTTMYGMFAGCSGLTSLDVSGFKTDNVTNMGFMFDECSGLTNLDVNHFITVNVTDMGNMFSHCSSLTSLDLSNFNTDNVTDMNGMFSYCSGLTNFDVSNFNTDNVTDMSSMFFSCSGLTSLDFHNFKTDKVKDMHYMFYGCSGLTSLAVSNFMTDNVKDMHSMFDNCSSLSTLDVSGFNTANVTDMSSMFRWCSGLISLNLSDFNTENVTDMSWMFYGCSSLTSLDVSGFNTKIVTNMSEMFYGCKSLTSLDVSHFNTENVKDMSYMFAGCSGLTSLDVSGFNTANVTNMRSMFGDSFGGCSGLTSLDLSNFDTSDVTNMGYMFHDCSNLMVLDLSCFNTAKVTSMSGMFGSCSGLATIYVGDGWNTESLASGDAMFSGCIYLIGGSGTHYDENHMDYTYAHIDGGTANPGYFTRSGETPYVAVDPYAVLSENNTVLTFYYDTKRAERKGMSVGPFTTDYYHSQSWYRYSDNITTVEFNPSFADCSSITSTAYWFNGCSNLTAISGIEYLKTDNVTDMSSMFTGCYSLTSLDVSGFNTENVTNMSEMFRYCWSLKTIYAGSAWITNAVTEGNEMFTSCTSLEGGAGTPYDENHVDYTYAHIDGGTSNPGYFTDKNAPVPTLPYAVLSENNTKLTFFYDDQKSVRGGMSVAKGFDDLYYQPWFSEVESITTAEFDPSFANCTTLTSTAYWFYGCMNMVSISGIEYLNTENVTNMDCMFAVCSSLTSLDVSHFNTANVTSMYGMFADCSKLINLDLSHFNTANVTSMSWMFNGCSGLKTIYVGSGWTTNAVRDGSNNMFSNCTSLVGGAGTIYDANHTDHTYAHIDGGASNPGYFTANNERVINGKFVTTDYSSFAYALEDNGTVIEITDNDIVDDSEEPGNRCIKIVSKDNATENWDSHFIIRIGEPLKEGQTYKFSMRAKASRNVSISSQARTAPDQYLHYRMLGNFDLTTGWQTYNVEGVVESEQAGCTVIALLLNVDKSSAEYFFDDISFRVNEAPSASPEPYAVLSENDTKLTFFYDTDKDARGGMGVGPFEDLGSSGVSTEWYGNKSTITTVVFDDSFANCTTLTSTAYWFYQLTKLTTITGIQNLKMDNVNDINSMFCDCESLTSLNLSSLNLGNVTNMHQMFEGCTGLENISFAGVNTENVTNMGDLFLNCRSLKTIDLSSFNTSKVTNMAYMFYRCTSLTTVYVSDSWTTANVTNSERMFERCNNIVGGMGTTFDENVIDASYARIDGGASNPGYFTAKGEGMTVNKLYIIGSGTAGEWDATTEMPFNDATKAFEYTIENTSTAWITFGIQPLTGDWDVFNSNYRYAIGNGNVVPVMGQEYQLIPSPQTGCVMIEEQGKYFISVTKDLRMTIIKEGDEQGTNIYVESEQAPYLYAFDANNQALNGDFPGNQMTRTVTIDGKQFWTTKISSTDPFNINIIDGNQYRTREIYVISDRYFTYLGLSSYRDVTEQYGNAPEIQISSIALAGNHNEWGRNDLFAEVEPGKQYTMDVDLTNVTLEDDVMQFKLYANACAWLGITSLTLEAPSYVHSVGDPALGTSSRNFYMDLKEAPTRHFKFEAVWRGGTQMEEGWTLTITEVNPAEAEPYAVLSDNNTKLTFFYDTEKDARGGMDVGPFSSSSSNVVPWYNQLENITAAEFASSFANCTSITSTAYWFDGCNNMVSISGIQYLNTANVTNMHAMFLNCSSLTNLDVSHFNTANVTDMSSMFERCFSLTSLDLNNFNTENVTNMHSMFDSCSRLASLNVSSFNTANVTDMGLMFSACYELTSLDVSGFNTDNVTDMHGMFGGSSGLTSLDLSNFKTDKVTTMFLMFEGCLGLTSLDLSSFNTENVTKFSNMFKDCSNLKTIYVGNDWNTSKAEEGAGMFLNCTSLVGGAGTIFDANHVDYTYAHIDGGSSNPGYFTAKNAPEGEATFDGKVARVSGERTLDEAFEQRGGRTEATRTIAAIIWNKESALTESDLQGITNPNLLVYVNEARLAPSNVQNVVINGLAREIVLTDAQDGNNDWYAPQAFVAERISYTRNFGQSTTKGTSRGWESIALPFDVQTIQHESKGVIAPFNNSASNKHFWLRRLTDNGLQAATNIEANTPYIISMPNSEEYTSDYNLNGRVTFSAQNIDVPATTTKVLALADSSIVMVPAMQRQSRSSSVWALNVGEVRGQYFEGSVFERDYRIVRPFEAYTIHRQENGQPAPRYVPIQEIAGVTGIETIDREPLTLNQWYDMQGRKLEGKPARKGVYISNGKKVVVK